MFVRVLMSKQEKNEFKEANDFESQMDDSK